MAEAGRAAKESEAPVLGQLYVHLTKGCNQRCRHCWLAPAHDPTGKAHPVLRVDLLEKALRQACALGLTTVKLTGGEPLLHPRIADILDLLLQHELRLNIETNGQLCSNALVDRIARFPRKHVALSLDGTDAATHDELRGVAGSFARAVAAAERLAAADIPLQIVTALWRATADRLPALVNLAGSLGASSLKLNPVQPISRGLALHEQGLALDVREVIELSRRYYQDPSDKAIQVLLDVPPAFRPLRLLATDQGASVCQIRTILGVLPTGHYALCGIGELVDELVFGSIEADPLRDVWAGNPVLQELRAGLPQRLGGICARCLLRRQCLGSCVAHNYFTARDLWAPYWLCQEAEDLGLFPKSRQLPDKL